jgi:hypothetical protein
MGQSEAGQHGPRQGTAGTGNGAICGVAEPRLQDKQRGHGYPISILETKVAVDLCTDPESYGETQRIRQRAGGLVALDEGACGLLDGGAEGVVLFSEMTGDCEKVGAKLVEEAEKNARSDDLQGSAGENQQGTNGGGFWGKRVGRGDEQEDDGLLRYPTNGWLAEREHAVDEGGAGGK